MIKFVINKVIGTQNQRALKKIQPLVEKINAFEPDIKALSDNKLRAKTDEFRQRLKQGQLLDDILPEAFAIVRETAKRAVNMRHFDAQLIGGVILHSGKIAEMATGEGKTLVATLAAYLNALTGEGVHIITVNDYLAKRDSEWMGPIYNFLGLSVGVIQHDLDPETRRNAYNCDITYGTNNEFGFDYLRDNMVVSKQDMVQRRLHYAIVDEVDSILIDEARTPLIISGPAEESTELYYKIDRLIPKFKEGSDFQNEEKTKTSYLTEEGVKTAEKLLGVENLYDDIHNDYVHHINQALRAHQHYKLDVDYMIKDGQVVIVDEFTGRLMPGRRWSDGLHQAIEAKENVKIERENQTLATITFQNLFRMYGKLSGMTGTAATEAPEFSHIYKLDVVVIPTNRPLKRQNFADVIYKTEKEKFDAVVNEIIQMQKNGRPVLVGTISIEKSERLSRMLRAKDVPHNVLNAKYHEMEAVIVAQAGRFAGVTIATNMAGRGTDITLGGNAEYELKDLYRQRNIDPKNVPVTEYDADLERIRQRVKEQHGKVVEAGGLHVLGTERHESRRIDNQLRGRSGRQGDPGSSKFFISLQDDLMRIFGSDRIAGIMDKLGMEEGQEIQHPFVSKAIETAQKRVEAYNFDIRKHLLEYDNVMNKQREVIYSERRKVLEGDDEWLKSHIKEITEEVLNSGLDFYLNEHASPEEGWDFDGLSKWAQRKFAITIEKTFFEAKARDIIRDELLAEIMRAYDEKEAQLGAEHMRHIERFVMLQVTDSRWKDHLYAMDNLRDGIGLRAYGQKDPLVEYQHEGYDMFVQMTDSIKEEVVEFVFRVQAVRPEAQKSVFNAVPQKLEHAEAADILKITRQQQPESRQDVPPEELAQYKRETPKVGRNDPCPCGKINPKTGKIMKYKLCCYPKYG
ncbi:MAG: preprotein translocase subunit SecA [Candidatus Omnitrophica bacterium CG12_big_fil_rev_8_21_14_0_65_43_15]|uniref:Protein translocase subunit SecA n=1 Tax=Candidatus Taenaricola geysiri TaxID=1974752 RepID=A0A2J0LME3_9BACT|nr:MAG: preprotein translocase subunit SecA [Candidatus Omnitrophica bacterium CG1_02_43_210]PIV12039.1 MAG: preprotein translocase subunit SecA [Candidatus Omnitrophica bacterium CG03_land_8_20_14_0_80_43_22]PIW65866.1 MAG: preprotein translocase subunit SecA [Candidatus Omnitrophica bacterium CG12_big_fil_rev_8_21_14_0_65_43_15]PIW80099.1 MAG: preprotein translocase subunit SecA [Candidatus Omnitrophica bacterium CG_4_8_14_3_um_filter_43_15]PIY84373.1 MAG: preprotein translocase subunit SecA 